MKIKPPKLGGAKLGIFATRSPHRPNPIGLSIAKVEAIKGNELHVSGAFDEPCGTHLCESFPGLKQCASGIDLVDGTPILDIKPYIPRWCLSCVAPRGSFSCLCVRRDAIPEPTASAPEWITVRPTC